MITQNGVFTIPNGKTGWNSFEVNVSGVQLPLEIKKFIIREDNNHEDNIYLSDFLKNQNSSMTVTIPSNNVFIYINLYNSSFTIFSFYNSSSINKTHTIYGKNSYYIVYPFTLNDQYGSVYMRIFSNDGLSDKLYFSKSLEGTGEFLTFYKDFIDISFSNN